MKSAKTPVASRDWLRVAVLALAGTVAFATAALLSSPALRDRFFQHEVVEPTERVGSGRNSTARPAPSQYAASSLALLEPGTERLGRHVAHNPFGALNLSADTGAIQGAAPGPRGNTAPVLPPKMFDGKTPEPAPAPLPRPPTAPQLPFTAVGSIAGAHLAGGKMVAFIRQQDQLLLISAGDTIGQSYRVDSVTSDKIDFTYLPLMQRLTLALTP